MLSVASKLYWTSLVSIIVVFAIAMLTLIVITSGDEAVQAEATASHAIGGHQLFGDCDDVHLTLEISADDGLGGGVLTQSGEICVEYCHWHCKWFTIETGTGSKWQRVCIRHCHEVCN